MIVFCCILVAHNMQGTSCFERPISHLAAWRLIAFLYIAIQVSYSDLTILYYSKIKYNFLQSWVWDFLCKLHIRHDPWLVVQKLLSTKPLTEAHVWEIWAINNQCNVCRLVHKKSERTSLPITSECKFWRAVWECEKERGWTRSKCLKYRTH